MLVYWQDIHTFRLEEIWNNQPTGLKEIKLPF